MKTQTESPVTAQHTPGPWHREPSSCVIRDANDNRVALAESIFQKADVAFANARLIAAAPELLAALELTADSMEWAMAAFPDIPKQSEFANRLSDARAAIAKARQS